MTDAEIKMLAQDWLKTLGPTPRDVFDEALQMHIRESRHWPTIHCILEKVDIIWNNRARETPRLEEYAGEPCTPEESAKFARDIRTLIKRNTLKSVRGGRKR